MSEPTKDRVAATSSGDGRSQGAAGGGIPAERQETTPVSKGARLSPDSRAAYEGRICDDGYACLAPDCSCSSRPRFRAHRERFRDPKGWLLDSLPWALRRIVVSIRMREWVPNEARYIGLRRPPREAFEIGRKLYAESEAKR